MITANCNCCAAVQLHRIACASLRPSRSGDELYFTPKPVPRSLFLGFFPLVSQRLLFGTGLGGTGGSVSILYRGCVSQNMILLEGLPSVTRADDAPRI